MVNYWYLKFYFSDFHSLSHFILNTSYAVGASLQIDIREETIFTLCQMRNKLANIVTVYARLCMC